MPRKKQTPIEFRIKALKVPNKMSGATYLKSLIDAMDNGYLAPNVKVELFWRNPDTKHGRSKHWQSDDFLSAVSESNGGFASALRTVIQRKLYGGARPAAPVRMVVHKKRKLVKKRKPVRLKRRIRRLPPRDKRGRFIRRKKK